HDLALHVEDIYARIGDSVGHCARLARFIEDVERMYDLRIGIGEQRIRDVLPAGKTLERSGRVVADGRYSKSFFSDRSEIVLQLHELDFAERSPIRGPKKDEHRSF